MSTMERTSTRDFWFADTLGRVLVGGEETDGRSCVVEVSGRRGSMPPLHAHHVDDEIFHVLDGEITVYHGADLVRLSPGDTVLAPRGVPHTYRIESETARVLVTGTPAGFERFIEAFGMPAARLDPRGSDRAGLRGGRAARARDGLPRRDPRAPGSTPRVGCARGRRPADRGLPPGRRRVRSRRPLGGRGRAGGAGDRAEPGGSQRPRPGRQPRQRSRAVLRGLLQLGRDRRVRAGDPNLGHRRQRRRSDGQRRRAPVPRPRAGQRGGHAPAHPLAPGPAVLQRRRLADVQRLDPRGSGAARVDARVRRRLPSRPVADAADVHGGRGEVVPGGHARRSAGHPGRPRRLPDPRVGARAGRRRVLQHADAPRRRRQPRPPPRLLGAPARRRRHPRPTALDDVAGVPGLEDELPAGSAMDHPLFPVVWERASRPAA